MCVHFTEYYTCGGMDHANSQDKYYYEYNMLCTLVSHAQMMCHGSPWLQEMQFVASATLALWSPEAKAGW